MTDEIHALVITYNRRELLMRNIAALKAQTHALKSIVVIDNGSTDDTQAAIKALNDPTIDHVRLDPNIGPARGFHYGIDYVFAKQRMPWVWIMDDDVIPSPTALAELVAAYHRNFKAPEDLGFLVSQSVDAEGRANNVPTIDTRARQLGECANWGLYLDQGMISIRTAPLSALLMPRSTYDTFGNLNQDFVVWGEDTDLTFRITEQRPGFLVGTSKILHLRAQPGDISIFLEDDKRRVPNFYYLYRNMLYVRRRYMGPHAYFNGIVRGVLEAGQLAATGKFWKAQIALRGVAAGIVFNPKPVVPRV
jgi:dTDP-4-dehydrorhamnose reductase